MLIRPPHIKLIALHHVKHSLRGGAGLVFVFLALVVGLLAVHISIFAGMKMLKDHGGQEAAVAAGRNALSWLMEMSPEQEQFLLVDQPVLISAILCVLMLLMPFLVSLGGFNQTSGDIGSKGLRYLLQRTERSNIFIGRFIGSYLFTLVVMAILYIIIGLFAMAQIKVHGKGEMFVWMLSGYARSCILILPYVALCSWVSCMIDSPFGALVIILMFTLLVPLAASITSMSNKGAANVIGKLMPGGWKYWLIDHSLLTVLAGIGIMLGFTALFGFLGLRHFEKRDL